ncbi:MAG: hypothetical protein DYG92_10235 [Leptolyngbya sp. PLA1]|nr:hypothetical protein [Leptolyngbya sp. PLA1]
MNARVGLLAAVLASAAILGGCHANEHHHFRSTVTVPQSVTLIDVGTGEQIWSSEVPVGKQLNMLFMRSPRSAERDGWDELRWSIASIGDDNGGKMSVVRVPPPSQRRIETEVRKGPELRDASAVAPGGPALAAPAPRADAAPKPEPAPKVRKTPDGIALPDPKQAAPK